jgi:tripartite-type tricarboxylate transporter receptor subunit TctC
VAETLPGFAFSSWNGFLAPTGTPEPILSAIRSEITALARSRQVSDRLNKLGITPGGLTNEQCEAVIKREHEAYATAIKAAGIKPPR